MVDDLCKEKGHEKRKVMLVKCHNLERLNTNMNRKQIRM